MKAGSPVKMWRWKVLSWWRAAGVWEIAGAKQTGFGVQVKDEEGKLMNDFSGRTKPNEVTVPEGFKRTITVALDTAQYQLDMDAMQESKRDDVYSSFNVLMRRKPKVMLLCDCWSGTCYVNEISRETRRSYREALRCRRTTSKRSWRASGT